MAGGFGTRISEESHLKPKPMIEIGGKPILWHIMKGYAAHGFNEFIICCGYKSEIIKQYFLNYFLYHCDITFDFRKNNTFTVHNNIADPWQVTVIDTGLHTMTGGRIKQIKPYTDNETFMLTYGDGLSDVNINKLLDFHRAHGKSATITVVRPESRFGVVGLDDTKVKFFREKSELDAGWINGGFMVLEQDVFDYIESDNTVFEKAPLEMLAKEGKLYAYKHLGFWQCMDTQRDKNMLEELWNKGDAPWKTWN